MSPVERRAAAMGPGAWGTRAGELLENAAERRGASIHRMGELAMLDPPHVIEGGWCCWLFGEPEDRGELAARFGLGSEEDLAGAFGHAIAEFGEAACTLLCGRFVIVALERERRRCLVLRDQLGVQPLIHSRIADGALFAEHERDLLELLERSPSPDRLALLQWIDSGLHPPERTLYEDLLRLPAGHRIVLGDRRARVERWWDVHYGGVEEGDAEALAARVRDAAFDAVRRAASGSERPAVKLSGGLDSACVAAGLRADGLADGHALAIGGAFSGYADTDESELIEATARHTQLPLELIPFNPASSMLAPALAHIARWRLPPATPNLYLWQPAMARARALGVDRMLDGEGGDELFGLAPYVIADRLRAGRLHSAWSLAGQMPGVRAQPSALQRLRILRRFGISPLVPIALKRWRQARTGRTPTGSIVPPADAQALAELSTPPQRDGRRGPLWWRFQVESLIDQRDALDMGGHYRRQSIEEAIDRRHPFLHDLQLVEAMLRIPPQAQFDPIRDRVLLRQGLRHLIPEAVRGRHEKSHFTPLVLEGLRAEEAGLIGPLRQADAPVRAYVATDALDRKVGVEPEKRSMLDAGSLWRVGIANRWLLTQDGASA
jgi:asparagine synthase (glutamine-hydrolysing)